MVGFQALRSQLSRVVHGPRFDDSADTWDSATDRSLGYSDPDILSAVAEAARCAREDPSLVERDGHILLNQPTDYRLIASLLLARASLPSSSTLVVCDIGGSLASKYYQTRPWHPYLNPFEWMILEQPALCEIGVQEHQTRSLRFHDSSQTTLTDLQPNAVLALSCLQYLDDPGSVLDQIRRSSASTVLLDQTPLVDGATDIAAVQRVRTGRYRSSYACWLLGQDSLAAKWQDEWKILDRWTAENGREKTVKGRSVKWSGLLAHRDWRPRHG